MPSLVEIGTVVLEKKEFQNFINVFSPFRNYLPLVKRVALHWSKLEFPSPKDAVCQVLLKLDQGFWRKRFLKFVNIFSFISLLSPLEKGVPYI